MIPIEIGKGEAEKESVPALPPVLLLSRCPSTSVCFRLHLDGARSMFGGGVRGDDCNHPTNAKRAGGRTFFADAIFFSEFGTGASSISHSKLAPCSDPSATKHERKAVELCGSALDTRMLTARYLRSRA